MFLIISAALGINPIASIDSIRDVIVDVTMSYPNCCMCP